MQAFIEAREVCKTYRVGKVDVPALRGISFSVQKGEFVTVVGPSGSGKSTLFYMLGGLTRADSGSVTIDGVDFATLSDGERTRLRKSKIGFVFRRLAHAGILRSPPTLRGMARPMLRSSSKLPACSALRADSIIVRTSSR